LSVLEAEREKNHMIPQYLLFGDLLTKRERTRFSAVGRLRSYLEAEEIENPWNKDVDLFSNLEAERERPHGLLVWQFLLFANKEREKENPWQGFRIILNILGTEKTENMHKYE
jgi:hypothetical protein